MPARGYAIALGKMIFIDTVSPTPRAAKVNFLWARKQVPVTNDWGDERVEATWEALKGPAECIAVDIARTEGA